MSQQKRKALGKTECSRQRKKKVAARKTQKKSSLIKRGKLVVKKETSQAKEKMLEGKENGWQQKEERLWLSTIVAL